MAGTPAIRVDGERLRALREKRLWSGYRLAAKAGMTPGTVYRIERTGIGTRMSVMRLVVALNLDPRDLIVVNESPPNEAA